MDRAPDVRVRLLKLLDGARTFDELRVALVGEVPLDDAEPPLVRCALRFVTSGITSGLDDELRERFAQVLSRFVESTRALELAGMLEAGE